VSSLIRETMGRLLLSKLADPRVDPARTSVTRVTVPEDLLTATVYVSVIGTDSEQRTTVRALQHAAGHMQELLSRQIRLRHTPVISFALDEKFKKTLETYSLIQKAMDDIHEKERRRAEAASGEDTGQPADEERPGLREED